MSKTPVSILQELMIRRCMVPDYQLLASSEGIGTHTPTFYYKVTADTVMAVGKGRSKKEAKHEAARLALEKLREPGNNTLIPDIPVSSPLHSSIPEPTSPQKIQINAIGALQELCIEKNIPLPEFRLISDVGPAHLRQFTVECTVATMSVTTTDTTKKKARQNAAQIMLHRLMDTLPEELEEMTIEPGSPVLKAIEPTDVIIKSFNEVSLLARKKTNWGLKIIDYSKTFKNIMEEKEYKFNDLWESINEENLDDLNIILNKLDLHYSVEYFHQEELVLAVVTIDTEPRFYTCSVAAKRDQAKYLALRQLMDFIKIMTK